jgi:UDP-glucose 4-epimerase
VSESVLVTGGAGYVGRELVRQLVGENGPQVHIIDNLASGVDRLRQVDLASTSVHLCDITDSNAVRRVAEQIAPSVIFHLAAIHYIPKCEADPGEAAAVNVAGTVNVLEAAPKGCKVVFASTAAVYAPEETPHREDASLVGPVDVYGITKLQGEEYVRYFHDRRDIVGVIVRLFNVVGPGETNPHLGPAIIGQLGRGERDIQLGNLFPKRDYIHVRDAAEGFIRLSRADGSPSGSALVCNLGTGHAHAVADMVAAITGAANVGAEVRQDPARVRAADRPFLCASVDRLSALTGWRPGITLDESMRDAWAARFDNGLA